MTPSPGLQATVTRQVAPADTAAAVGSGDLPVLGTPIVVAAMEQAACAALAGSLADDQSTVGVHLDVSHVAASAVGSVIHASATLVEVDGRRLRFAVAAEQDGADGRVEIAHGTHTRVVVDRERFLAGVRA